MGNSVNMKSEFKKCKETGELRLRLPGLEDDIYCWPYADKWVNNVSEKYFNTSEEAEIDAIRRMIKNLEKSLAILHRANGRPQYK